MLTTVTHRPRNVDALRAGAILYGDWGTSKAYVIGLAFALAGYASFWLIAAVSVLSLLVGLNYITVCKYYPNGGGVYASVRHRSPIISMVGAFFLIADYLVTAALSALSAAYYFGIGDPLIFACIAIVAIACFNYFGPRHVGTFVFAIMAVAVVVLLALAGFSIPHLKAAWENIKPLTGSPLTIWNQFVGVIVALSGVEAIANITGVMKLNPGATNAKPQVTKTSTRAIAFVMVEVIVLTSLFGFAAAAIPNFELSGGTVNAPDNPNVRDYMLRYLGEVFAGNFFGAQAGVVFGWVISGVVGVLLLTAVNTAINGLIALQYVMASDGEMPHFFQKLNRFGVPIFPLIIGAFVPVILVLTIKDVEGLAALYAIGFVGAIAANLGSTSTDFNLGLKKRERILMFFTFLIMSAVEITLFIDKPHARNYAVYVILIGLFLRALASEFKLRKMLSVSPKIEPAVFKTEVEETPQPCILCVASFPGRAVNLAIEKSKKRNIPLHVLFVREQNVIGDLDVLRTSEKDREAARLFSFVEKRTDAALTHTYFVVSDSKPDIIAAYVMRLEATEVFISSSQKGHLIQMLKGDTIRTLTRLIPPDVHLYVIP